MVRRVFKNLGQLLVEMRVGDQLEVIGFDIQGVYKIIDGAFNEATKAERANDIFTYAHNKYKTRSRNVLKVPDLFSEIMLIERIK
jgi:hypothetical protein